MIAISTQLLNSDIIKKLPDNYGINKTGGVIRMDQFLSFITVKLNKTDGLGSDMGWSYRKNDTGTLIIQGGGYKGVEWLDCIRYGKNLQNPYNNFVNLFGVWDILNDNGRTFVLNYYKKDLEELICAEEQSIAFYNRKISICESKIQQINEIINCK